MSMLIQAAQLLDPHLKVRQIAGSLLPLLLHCKAGFWHLVTTMAVRKSKDHVLEDLT